MQENFTRICLENAKTAAIALFAIAAADFSAYRSIEKSVCQTRLLNALHQESLKEGIEDHQRENDH